MSPYVCAASGSRSASVRDLVPRPIRGESSSASIDDDATGFTAGRDAAQRSLEEGSVDSSVEDRDAHLDALPDHLLPLHLQLVGELARRQVMGHRDLHVVESGYVES